MTASDEQVLRRSLVSLSEVLRGALEEITSDRHRKIAAEYHRITEELERRASALAGSEARRERSGALKRIEPRVSRIQNLRPRYDTIRGVAPRTSAGRWPLLLRETYVVLVAAYGALEGEPGSVPIKIPRPPGTRRPAR